MSSYILTLPNTTAGRRVLEDLREYGPRDYGARYEGSLGDLFRRQPAGEGGALIAAELVDRVLPHSFHEIDILEGDESATVHRLMRQHNDPRGDRPKRGFIEAIELNHPLELASIYQQLFQLGGDHRVYLRQLGVPYAQSCGLTGSGVKIAVIDTGSDRLPFVSDFYDLTYQAPSTHPGRHSQVDLNGHGTAMATLIHEVACDSQIDVIRICDGNPQYFHVLAAVALAVFDCHAHVVNMSLGFKSWGGRCNLCGTHGVVRSIAFEKLLDSLLDLDPGVDPHYVPPIYVAATGNKGAATLDYPAGLENVVAVGSVDSGGTRSSFSNYGTGHPYYLLAPGGQEVSGNALEHVGFIQANACKGTSVATAYVSGMMALLLENHCAYYPGVHARDQVLQDAISMCTIPPLVPATEYGHGVIRF